MKNSRMHIHHNKIVVAVFAALLVLAVLSGFLIGKSQSPSTSSKSSVSSVPPGTLTKCRRVARVEGMTISSGFRTIAHNREVGGVQNSMHTLGSPSNPGACDFSGTVSQYTRGAVLCKRLGSTEILIHAVPGGGGLHLHCGWAR